MLENEYILKIIKLRVTIVRTLTSIIITYKHKCKVFHCKPLHITARAFSGRIAHTGLYHLLGSSSVEEHTAC